MSLQIETSQVHNATDQETRVVVGWHVMNYSDITERSFSVKPGKTVLSGRAVFRWEDLHKLENPVTANMAYTLICGPAGKEEKLDAGQFGI